MDVIVARPPKDAQVVAVLVDLEMDVDPSAAATRVREAAEVLRRAGFALVLLPDDVEVQTNRRRRWRPIERKKR